MEKEIPKGSTREDIKARKKIIWNKSLRAYIHVKFQSINETKGHASVSYESTCAVLKLTDVLENAIVSHKKPAKTNDKNQKSFDQMIILYHGSIRLLVGHQKSTNEYVQYCVGGKNKASLGR